MSNKLIWSWKDRMEFLEMCAKALHQGKGEEFATTITNSHILEDAISFDFEYKSKDFFTTIWNWELLPILKNNFPGFHEDSSVRFTDGFNLGFALKESKTVARLFGQLVIKKIFEKIQQWQ